MNSKSLKQQNKLTPMTFTEYIEKSQNSFVIDTLARYRRGDLDYIQALERITVHLLANQDD